tara:strand:- start:2066 stop:3166 length:1101 start_codon:yes stop_codon:yes gene_type:complete
MVGGSVRIMVGYWIMFSVPAFFAVIANRRLPIPSTGKYKSSIDLFVFLWIITLTLLIGLRDEVGGDWLNYLLKFQLLDGIPFAELFERALDDPLYNIINWVSSNLKWGVYGTNLICAFIFSYGLGVFCKKLPRPWLGLTVAVPYLVIVVAMGYTRQSVALGLVMLGLAALSDQKIRKFVIYIIIAAMAHKSAILMLPIAGLAASKNRLAILAWMSLLGLAGYFIFLADSMDFFIYGYIELDYQSQGAFIRLLMNSLPALIMVLFYKRFNFPPGEKRIWIWFALISLGLMLMFFTFPSSSALDRVALYMLPIQIVTFSYLPDIFTQNKLIKGFLILSIIFYYALVQFVWLNYAVNSWAWLPYQSIII